MINFSDNIDKWTKQIGFQQSGWLSSRENQDSDPEGLLRRKKESQPSIQPGAQFRNDLHRALESTHRQHTAQRTLGIRRSYTEPSMWHHPLIKLPALVLATAALLYIWRYRKSQLKK